MALPLSKEEVRALLEQILQEPELRAYLQAQLSEDFAERSSTERHLANLYEELLRSRQESEARWQASLAEMRADGEVFRAEMRAEWEDFRTQMKAEWETFRTEMNASWEAFRTEMRTSWETFRTEMNASWEAFRTEMRAEGEAFRAEMRAEWEAFLAQSRAEAQKHREESEARWQASLAEMRAQWEKYQEEMREIHLRLEKLEKRLDSSIGALGARWGIYTEGAFREGIKALLEQDFQVKVKRYVAIDAEGKVFNRPDQVEIDVIIYNGKLILMEVKSALHRGDVHLFLNKVAFYEEREQRKPDRLMLISPFIHKSARDLAELHNIELYTFVPDTLES